MATEDCKDLLTSGSQPEDVGSDFYDDANIKAAAASEKKEEDFLTALEDDKTDGRVKNGGVKNDKKAEEANVNTDGTSTVSKMIVELSTSMVDGHEKADERDEKDVENDKKAEAVNSSSNKETKKVVRKRKNAEETSVLNVSSPPKMVKKKMNDISATKMKETPPRDKPIEGNEKNEVKSDEKLESIVKGAVPEDEKEADMTDVKVVKKAEGTAKKTVKIAKKKIVAKAKGGSSNAESAPTKSASVAEVATTLGMDENAKQNVESLASEEKNVTPAVEKKDVEGTKDNSNETETLDEKVAISSSIDADKVNDADKPTPSAGEKRSKMADTAEKQLKHVDGMGLIFMCNAKTKKDCFKYNILGLPESKKELVAKIYKGMRLFLFDFDLKLLYGIYKAASPGGYNIEPKAFDSKFPSQVRFIVLRDCLPLPEEKFKEAMKENYYKRSKFNCQLSAEQVKNLCKLFQSATGNASQQNHRAGNVREVTMQRSSASELKRRRVGRDHPRNERYGREAYPSPPPRVRYLSPPPRARYLSPPSRALPSHTFRRALPSTLPSYALERPADDYYSRGHHRVLDLEMRPRDPPMDYQDPYILYREPGLYSEPLYQPSLPPAYAARLREPRSPPRYPY